MQTFKTIKKKIQKYQDEIELLKDAIKKEENNLINEIFSYWQETKFIRVKNSNNKQYYYLSNINMKNNNEFNGIRIDSYGKLYYGTMNINSILIGNEYETITPDIFFSKLKSIGENLEGINNPITIEALKFKPKSIIDENKKHVIGYCRLSKDAKSKNKFNRQISIINDFAKKIDNDVCEVFTEVSSGTIPGNERQVISDLIEFANINNIKTLIISELNRLGRLKNIIISTISFLFKKGITEIYSVKENILINEEFIINEFRNLNRLAQICEDEYDAIKYRMKEGYNAYVKKRNENIEMGIHVPKLGRNPDSKKEKQQYMEQYQKEIDLLNKNISIRQVSLITGASPTTVMKIKKMFNITKTK